MSELTKIKQTLFFFNKIKQVLYLRSLKTPIHHVYIIWTIKYGIYFNSICIDGNIV